MASVKVIVDADGDSITIQTTHYGDSSDELVADIHRLAKAAEKALKAL